MANNKPAGNRGKTVSFVLAVVLLAAAVISSIALFLVTTVFQEQQTGEFTRSLYPIKYEYYVESAAKENSVDVCLIYGVIRTESNFNPKAVSQAGAIGLMQLMPDTFTWLQNYRTDFMPEKLLDSSELYDPQTNIEYGTYLLRFLLDHYSGNVPLTICAYNAGYGNVDSWLADGTIPREGVTSDRVPFTETANYLDRVTEAMENYRTLYYSNIDIFDSDTDTDTNNVDSESDVNSETALTDTDDEEELLSDADDWSDDDDSWDDEDGYYNDDDDNNNYGSGIDYSSENSGNGDNYRENDDDDSENNDWYYAVGETGEYDW